MNYIKKLMEDNNLEVNEEFYIFYDKNRLGKVLETSLYFDEKLYLVGNDRANCYIILRGLMSGEYKIKKIPHKPKTVWDLKYGDDYWYINSFGHVRKTSYGLEDDFKRMIEFGNAFLTEEEAEHEIERRKCEAILLKYGTRNFMSFRDINSHKYFIMYNSYRNGIGINFNQCDQSQGTIYFKSAKLAQKAIEEVGEDRLKKYVFNVKE